MENIGEKIESTGSDELGKIFAEMEKRGIEISAKEFGRKLLELLNGAGENDWTKGIERIKGDLSNPLFKNPNEKVFLELLRDEIQVIQKKTIEFDNLQINPYKTLLIKSLPPETKVSDYEQRKNSGETETVKIEDIIKDKETITKKIEKTKNAVNEYLNKANLIKEKNSATYICLVIKYLDVVQKEIKELNNMFDKYVKLLKKEIKIIKEKK